MTQLRNTRCLLLTVIISVIMWPFVLTKTEHTTYEHVVQLINRYAHAMDPEQQEDKLLMNDLPELYFDALETHAAEQGGVIDSNIVCALLVGIFKNYANIIKDKLALGKSPYISKKFIASTANWSTRLLEITLEKSFHHNLTIRVCDNNTKTPLELACYLMLHKPMMMLLARQGAGQLYNCLLLSTVNSDVEGFDLIWQELCHAHGCADSCEVTKKTTDAIMLSKGLRNIQLSSYDVACFQCKRSNLCIMLDHMCKVLCHDLCSQHYNDVISQVILSYVRVNGYFYEHLSCHYGYKHIVNGYHGWRTGFVMETDKCQIPVIDIGQLSEEMLEMLSSIKQPIIIKGVGKDWRLSTKWTRRYLQKHHGAVEVLVRSWQHTV